MGATTPEKEERSYSFADLVVAKLSVTQLDELGIFDIGYAGEATETAPEKWVELEQWKV